MKLVKYHGKSSECLENFPTDTSRSHEGAIHLWPGRVVDITDDEYAYIKGQRPSLAKRLLVLRSQNESMSRN